jgi:hypothetical protein
VIPDSERQQMRERLRRDMFMAARDLLGGGYVAEYYESAASDFIAVAWSYITDALDASPAAEPVSGEQQ